MSIDLSQFHQVFFEESFEGLDIMESNLLALNLAEVDSETINTIFRAAHSIKGGAGTFGFMQISNFTHALETLLDEIRSGVRDIEQEHIDMLLECVDCLRELMNDLQAGGEPDMAQADALKLHFEKVLATKGSTSNSASVDATSVSAIPVSAISDTESAVAPEQKLDDAITNNSVGWRVHFIPCEDVLCTGNEPYRMFRELKELAETQGGGIDVVSHRQTLPPFSEMHPEMCYLSWTITVRANVELPDIEEIFEWVIDDCDIRYESLSDTGSESNDSEVNLDKANDTAVDQTVDDGIAIEEFATGNTQINSSEINVEISTELEADASVTAVPLADEIRQETKTSQTVAATSSPKDSPVKATKKNTENTSIRVSIDKIDGLINMVGELVITQSMLGQLGQEFDMSRIQRLQEGLAQLEQNTRELQESVMKIRMLPISFAFSRFPRLIRDLSKQLSKEVDLEMIGENTELDKTVMEKIGDPLVHLVRNSLDHGLECADERIRNGKSSAGKITLNAFHHGGSIVIEVKDDGAGLNKDRIRNKALEKGLITQDDSLTDDQIYDLIFQPGFSTADVVSDVSGRGVGMDVVKRNITELNGSIEVSSTPGEGSVFSIRLPLTLAILDGQLVKVGNEIYIFPLVSIVESIQLEKSMLNNITGSQYVMQLRNDYVPIISLQDIFNIKTAKQELEGAMLVVVEGDNGKVGVVVDELLGQQQVVIKSLEKNYQKVDSISGATILGDGTVALIIDVSGLNNRASDKKNDTHIHAA